MSRHFFVAEVAQTSVETASSDRDSLNATRVQLPNLERLHAARVQLPNRFSRGLSLLEVVLALSILGIATGILSSILNQAADNGLKSRRMTQAQMVCEIKMAEAMSGAIALQSTGWMPAATTDGTNWYYMLELLPAEVPNMIGIGILATDEIGMAESQRPLARLVQWMIDPNLGLDTKPVTQGTDTSATGNTGATGATTGGAQ